MKKTLILCTAILAANFCFSQDNLFGRVGINTSNPRASLHVEGGVGATPDSIHALFMNKNFIPGSPQLILYSLTSESGGTYGIQAVRAGLQANGNLVINELGGNVGIGNPAPKRALHVDDVMRLEPRNSAPSSPSKGDIYFDNVLNKLRVYDGTIWQNCW